jgi:hypothetical protein
MKVKTDGHFRSALNVNQKTGFLILDQHLILREIKKRIIWVAGSAGHPLFTYLAKSAFQK